METLKSKYIFKVVICGEGGVGKTTFIDRYASNTFNKNTKITIGAGFYAFYDEIDTDTTIKLQVWDFGGEKRFRFILPSYCQGAHGVIFAFDLTRSSSLLNLGEWVDLVNNNTDTDPVFLLIGTKADKIGEAGSEAVNDEKITEFMRKHDFVPDLFFKTSSKSGENVKDVFSTLSNLLYARVSQLNA
jgi:small GTP-binding protein